MGATVSINDPNGVLIARTLNPERWVGRLSSPAFLERIRQAPEGAFRNVGVDGQHFYTAYRRSERWGWIVGTGVPVTDVEKALRGSTFAVAGGAFVLVTLALVLAMLFGKRIAGPVSALAESAAALASGTDAPAPTARSIAEVAHARRAFDEARALLARRQEALNSALHRERVARAEAENASRGKDEFIAMLGHELRNPLGAITSAVAVLDRADDNPEAVARAHSIIGRQIAVLTKLVDDLLDVARVTSGKIVLHPGRLDLAQAVRHAIDVLAGAGRLARHELRLDLVEAWTLADATRIEQIVANLVENAAKYTPPGGRIVVAVRPHEGDVVLEVSDTGMGIAPDLLPLVFDLFTQEERARDRAQGGLGLGLTLVRRLVELHGGQITAASEGRGRGATFTVRLPRIDPPALGTDSTPAPATQIRPLRILLVEDNVDGRVMLRELLRLGEHEVYDAPDGPAGVTQAAALQPHVAIIDIGLPGIDGYEVARRVRATEAGDRITLVALTGYGADEDRRLAHAAGFDAYLVKPLTPESLARVLAAVDAARGPA
jgi:signal transduction histidine kinase/ActR/RegA family two-component response regulator